jgi:hypothetical protein
VVCVLSAVSAVSVHAAVAPTIELDPARPGRAAAPPLSRFFSQAQEKGVKKSNGQDVTRTTCHVLAVTLFDGGGKRGHVRAHADGLRHGELLLFVTDAGVQTELGGREELVCTMLCDCGGRDARVRRRLSMADF